tara:strand:- start:42 stop:773 length:732 start_codon:yes stop_codon:yes gene_type:complete
MNCLILFSGTKSFSKMFLNEKNKKNFNEIKTVDLSNHFKPTYNVDILKWDYKKDLNDFKIDYLHSSPVCSHFTKLKNTKTSKRDLELGFSLFDKTIEIIEWIQENNNSKLKFTIENPKSKLTLDYEPLKKFKHTITSYCQYGYMYQKNTIFWYGGFDLTLKTICNKKNKCLSKLSNDGIHKVRIGMSSGSKVFLPSNKGQIGDHEHYKELRKLEIYKNQPKMTNQFFRYRIPEGLIQDIIDCI